MGGFSRFTDTLLLTKADKLSQSARSKQVKMVREAILPFQGDIQVEAFSAQNKIGIDKLAAKLDFGFRHFCEIKYEFCDLDRKKHGMNDFITCFFIVQNYLHFYRTLRIIMSLAIVYSRASMGVQAPLVTIEVHLSNGKPGFTLVGLPEKTVKEAQDRVRSALMNAQFKYPAKRITVNLALRIYRKKAEDLICLLLSGF